MFRRRLPVVVFVGLLLLQVYFQLTLSLNVFVVDPFCRCWLVVVEWWVVIDQLLSVSCFRLVVSISCCFVVAGGRGYVPKSCTRTAPTYIQ